MTLVELSEKLNNLIDLNIDPKSQVMILDEDGVISNIYAIEIDVHEEFNSHTIWLKVKEF